jgi:hypothetical protein
MRYSCLPLLLLAALLQPCAAASTDEPATSRLKLIRLQPVPAGKPWPVDERFERFTRSVSFSQNLVNNVPETQSPRAEKEFRAIVSKEPATYQTEHPLRAVLTLAGNKYAFAVDRKSKKSVGYDRLYFDLNGNGDLTDDAPIDAPDADKTAKPEKSNDGWVSIGRAFPRVDFKIRAKDREWDYSLLFIANTNTRGKDENLWVEMRPAAYREGEITLQGKKRQIALVDWNMSGRFDVPITFASDGKGDEVFLGQYGTEILFDKSVPIDKHLPIQYMSEHRQFLAKMNALGGTFYKISITPGGEELTCTPVALPMGKIVLPRIPCNLWLINEQGLAALDLQKDTPVDLPAGNWRLLYCTFWQHRKEADATPQSPTLIHLGASGDTASEPITVIADQTTTLRIGPPFVPTLKVERRGEHALLNLDIRGLGNEKVDSHILGIKQAKQRLKITDPEGKVVEQGDFEYG